MNGSSRHLDTLFKRFFVNVKSVVALTAKRGDKCRMHVYHLVSECVADLLVKYRHKACVDYEIGVLLNKSVTHCLAVSGNIGVVLSCKDSCLYSVISGSCKSISVGFGCYNTGYLASAESFGLLCVDKRLQISSAARNQNNDILHIILLRCPRHPLLSCLCRSFQHRQNEGCLQLRQRRPYLQQRSYLYPY